MGEYVAQKPPHTFHTFHGVFTDMQSASSTGTNVPPKH